MLFTRLGFKVTLNPFRDVFFFKLYKNFTDNYSTIKMYSSIMIKNEGQRARFCQRYECCVFKSYIAAMQTCYVKKTMMPISFLLSTDIYILLDVLVCSIAVYFYELCGILTSP